MMKFVLHAILIVLFFNITSCSSHLTPEEQIIEYIAEVEKIAENRDLRGLKKLISENYTDKNHRKRKDILQIAASYFLRNKTIFVLTRYDSINFSESHGKANVIIYAAISKSNLKKDDMELLQAEIHRFEIDLEKISEEWQLSSAKWQRATIDDFLEQ